MKCPHCNGEMTPGGVAITCGPKLASTTLQLPAYCASQKCRDERDKKALARAVAAGVIDP